MKTLIILLTSISLLTSTFAQGLKTNEIPASIRESFKTKFSSAQKAEWDMVDESTYEVSFIQGKQFTMASFDLNGKWLKTETELTEKEIPNMVIQALTKHIGKFIIEEAEKIESPNETTYYELQIEKGEEIYIYQVSEAGDKITELNDSELDLE